MRKLKQYTEVRVVKLVQSPDKYNGWKLNKRPPQIGDIGTLIDYLPSKGKPRFYIVEKSDPVDGTDIWLVDFLEEEIEPFSITKKRKSFFSLLKSMIPKKYVITKKVKISYNK
jgi:hypothetical protein